MNEQVATDADGKHPDDNLPFSGVRIIDGDRIFVKLCGFVRDNRGGALKACWRQLSLFAIVLAKKM